MIILDTELQRREEAGNPVGVGLVGAGFMGRGIVRQIERSVPGMRLVAVANRTPDKAVAAYTSAGRDTVRTVTTVDELEAAARAGEAAVTDDHRLLAEAPSVDVIIEATGHVGHGAEVTTHAIAHGTDVVLMNAEVDATVGPLLQRRARDAGVIVTGCDGDQPGVQMNLIRFVRSIGLTPLIAGNIKGLQDHYRTPETQQQFAAQWGQTAHMVTSFADGTKISFEQALVANATGMRVTQRGMLGLEHKGHVDELTTRYLDHLDLDAVRALGGAVDYVVGASPSPGVYVMAVNDHDDQEVYLRYGKLGDGPLYSFYVPYHLTILEAPLSAARVALFRDHVISGTEPVVDVAAVAKRDLRAGETVDGLGGFMTYGVCENHDVVRADSLLPIGLAEGAVLRRDVEKDAALRMADVDLPDTLVHRLRAEQDAMFSGEGA
jgi:predicted homoserine dehydrogenase-like protein